MTQLFQVDPPEPFSFKRPDELSKWIRGFEMFPLASALYEKEKVTQVNTLQLKSEIRRKSEMRVR